MLPHLLAGTTTASLGVTHTKHVAGRRLPCSLSFPSPNLSSRSRLLSSTGLLTTEAASGKLRVPPGQSLNREGQPPAGSPSAISLSASLSHTLLGQPSWNLLLPVHVEACEMISHPAQQLPLGR